MINHFANHLALRAHAVALSVATTGSISLAASAAGGAGGASAFIRTTGSFVTDGFAVGMEIVASGFAAANNVTAVITGLTALVMTINETLVTAAASGSRTIVAGLPSDRAWENLEHKPTVGKPYVREQYIPGPSRQFGLGPNGEIEILPMYALHVHVPANVDMTAAARYADALITHFAPRTAITVGSNVLRVRPQPGPFRGELMNERPEYATVPVTFPLRLETANSI